MCDGCWRDPGTGGLRGARPRAGGGSPSRGMAIPIWWMLIPLHWMLPSTKPTAANHNALQSPVEIIIVPKTNGITAVIGDRTCVEVNRVCVVLWDINCVGIDWFDAYGIAVGYHLRLLGGLEILSGLCQDAQALDGSQHVLLLAYKCCAYSLRPVDLIAHHFEDGGVMNQAFDRVIPILRGDVGLGGIGFGCKPLVGRGNILRISG